MGVNGISSYNNSNLYSVNFKLPEYLQVKLLELGINPETVGSIQEANKLIQNAENENNNSNTNTVSEKTEEIIPNDPIRKKAEILASELGVQVNETDTTETILKNIQNVINQLLEYAKSEGDEGLCQKLLSYQHRLDSLIAEYNGGGDVNNNTVYNVLDAMAEQNKYSLGLFR